MSQFHIRFDAPYGHPYDTDNVHWNLLGNVVLPFVQENNPSRFWFSRYAGKDCVPHIFLRYESDNMATHLPIPAHSHHEFDIAEDLSIPRFLGQNQQNPSRIARGNLLFDFLHAASRLTLAQLSHQDSDGYWQLEYSPDLENNHYGWPLESIHHLFCNLSSVPTAVVLIPLAEATPIPQIQLISPLYAKMQEVYSSDYPVVRVNY